MSTKKTKGRLILFLIWSLTFFLFLISCINNNSMPNSDGVSYIVLGKSIFNGNIGLSGWYTSTNSFYLLSLIYGIFGLVFGYKVGLVYIVTSFLFATMICLICYIILKDNQNTNIYNQLFLIFICVTFAFTSVYFNTDKNIYSGAHFDVAIISILSFYIISNEFKKDKFNYKKISILYVVLLIGASSDSLVLFFTIIPMLLVLLLNLVRCVHDAKHKKYLAIQIGCISTVALFSKVFIYFIGKMGGFIIPGSKISISMISVGDIWNRISYFLDIIFGLFGANVMGNAISFANTKEFLCATALLIFICLLLLDIKRLIKDIFVQINITVIFVITLILMFTEYARLSEGIYASRLTYILFFSLLILFTKVNFRGVLERLNLNRKPIMICIALMMCTILLCSLKDISFHKKQESQYEKVSNILEEKGLEKGYASYWLSHMVTTSSEFRTEVAPITGSYPSRLFWISQDTKKWDYANFIIIDDSGEWEITRESLEKSIGVPAEVVAVNNEPIYDHDAILINNIFIYIWDKNIIPYIRGIDYNMKTIKAASMNYSSGATVVNMNSLEIPADQVMYGPYIELEKGSYEIEYSGENLLKAEADINSQVFGEEEARGLEFEVVTKTDKKIILKCTLPQTIIDFETRLFNKSSEKIVCNEVKIQKITKEKI